MLPSNHRLAERNLVRLVRSGKFRVTESGEVWRFTKRYAVRAEKTLPSGYLMVRAMIDGKRVVGLAHRLVWQVFNGDIPEGMVINHRNGLKSDNRVCNLEVATYGYNARHAHRVLGVCPQHGHHNPGSKLTAAQVAEIRLARARGEKATDVAKRFGIVFQTVYRLWNGTRWGHLKSPDNLRVPEVARG